jgi:hypothetical protein
MKLVHLVGFTTKKFMMHGHMNVKTVAYVLTGCYIV